MKSPCYPPVRRWEAILLAAGASSRMGTPKALLPWGERTLLGHQISELLATRIARVALVLGAYTDALVREPHVALEVGRGRVRVVVNRAWSEGKCGSIRLGAGAVSPGATDIALLAVDQPTAAEVLEALMGEHEVRMSECSVPRFDGRGGHPLLLSTRYTPQLLTLSEETQGLRALLHRLERSGRVQRVPVAAPCVRWDLNRPEDVAAVRGS